MGILVAILLLLPDPLQKANLLRDLRFSGLATRIAAVQAVTTSPEMLADPAVQGAVIALLQRESSDPNWGGKAEFQQYEEYYDALIRAVQTVAAKSSRSDAWRALAKANYNDDSQFAKWLAWQPGAFSTLLELSKVVEPHAKQGDETRSGPSADEVVRAHMTFVLAETCSLTGQHCDRVLPILRTRLTDKSGWIRLAAVRGLGLCGTASDVKLLQQMETGLDQMQAADVKGAWLHFVKTSEEDIRARLQ